MRTVSQWLIAFASFALVTNAKSQGMIYIPGAFPYISNVTNNVEGNATFGADQWLAQPFQTGSATEGYVTKAIVLGASTISGSFGIIASLYTNNGDVPGSEIGELNGQDLTLLPDTTYWIVLANPSSTTPTSNEWAYSSNANYFASDNWLMGMGYTSSDGGASWALYNTDSSFQMGIEATPVPEPASCTLFFIGIALSLFLRMKIIGRFRCVATLAYPLDYYTQD